MYSPFSLIDMLDNLMSHWKDAPLSGSGSHLATQGKLFSLLSKQIEHLTAVYLYVTLNLNIGSRGPSSLGAFLRSSQDHTPTKQDGLSLSDIQDSYFRGVSQSRSMESDPRI